MLETWNVRDNYLAVLLTTRNLRGGIAFSLLSLLNLTISSALLTGHSSNDSMKRSMPTCLNSQTDKCEVSDLDLRFGLLDAHMRWA